MRRTLANGLLTIPALATVFAALVVSTTLVGCAVETDSVSEERIGYVELDVTEDLAILVEIQNDTALAPVELNFSSDDVRAKAMTSANRGDLVVVHGFAANLESEFGFWVDSLRIIQPNNLPGTVPSAR